jgi:alpha-D-ribose 1-methylphosphonate 5-triphosphate diphosphatase
MFYMNNHILSNAMIVTPEANFMGSLVIENGIITEILREKNLTEGKDLHGLWLSPGCIDIHSDYLESEIHPRPNADFPLPLAFHFMDQRAAACGLTTVFSAISFSDNEQAGRAFITAVERAEAFDILRKTALVNHYVHARLDPNSDSVIEYLDRMKAISSLKLVVYNDSIPGQRQFRFDDLVVKKARHYGISLEEAGLRLKERIDQLSQINRRPEIQQVLGDTILLGSHDDTKIEHVEEAGKYGSTLSEMPTTIDAARKARELGMFICMGAPNYLRGGSHCGNLACQDAMDENLMDILCSDYHFPTMMGAVIKMIANGISPSEAINFVSLNPAKFLGIDHYTGSVEEGKQADLICFDSSNGFAQIRQVWVNGLVKLVVNPYMDLKEKASVIS